MLGRDNSRSPDTNQSTRRVLFVAEAVTLAHVARPVVLARTLDSAHHEVHLAWDPRYRRLFGDLPFLQHAIRSIPVRQFLDALARGRPVYDVQTLRDYVREDLKVLDEVRPDLVVGDFRLSLAVSARLAGVPYLAICNAYWSPHARQRYPVPELPFNRVLGLTLGGALFRLLRPLAFALHTRPLNRVRRQYGLPTLGLDLRRVYTEADHVLYADVPELIPTFGLPTSHHYLGPVLWSPAVSPPDWWDEVPRGQPVIYITLGSSGRGELLDVVLDALAELPMSILAAKAGRADGRPAPANAFVADYLPGCEAAARASLVICNGGSPTTQQALAAGVPVLGIPDNLDQHLNMQAICEHRAGEVLRAGAADAPSIRRAVQGILADPAYAEAARRLAAVFSRYDAPSRFRALVGQILGETPNEAESPPLGRAAP
jgi:UDP:flavonoid glycosyltransferase YjiC (YdhE family)